MRGLRLLTVMLIALVLWPAQPAQAQGPLQVWVDDGYSLAGANDGHVWGSDAFGSISTALRTVARGGTVYVLPGRYQEDVRITRACKLVAQGPGRAIVTPFSADATIIVAANGVTVEGLDIEANRLAGILVLGPDFQRESIRSIVVRGNAIHGGLFGVAVNVGSVWSRPASPVVSTDFANLSSPWDYGVLPAAGVAIRDNNVSGCKRAIYVYNTEAEISDNVIGGLAADGIGIYSSQGSASTIRANTVTIDAPNGRAISILDNRGTSIEGNRLAGTTEALTPTTAVALYGFADLLLSDNTVDGFYAGVTAYTGGSVRVARNTFNSAVGWALNLGTAITTTQATIEGNVFRGSYLGLRLDDDGGYGLQAAVVDNGFYDNVTGIQLTVSVKKGQAQIRSNTFCGNVVAGLRNESEVPADATDNWWGANDGPSPQGSGDRVEGLGGAVVDPWLRLQASSRAQPDGRVAITASLGNSRYHLRDQSLTFTTNRGTFVETGSATRTVLTDWRGEAQATLNPLAGEMANVTVNGACGQGVILGVPAMPVLRGENTHPPRPLR